MPQAMIWLSYDLGVRGDYVGLYNWLDLKKAKECGDSVAVLPYEYQADLKRELLAEIKDAVECNKQTRLYLVYRDPVSDKNKGTFILGRRRASAWTGYAADGDIVDEEIAS